MSGAADPTPGGLLDRPWMFWAMLAGATALGAALRLHGLGSPSFWVDEFFTIARCGGEALHVAQIVGYLPTWVSLWLSGAELEPIRLANIAEWPGYGVHELAARLGPCWVGIATVPLLTLLARPVAGGAVAGASALILAISPWHIYWSQMARFYSLQFLLAGAFVLLFARAMQTGGRGLFAAAGLAAVLALLAHPTTIFVIASCAVVLSLAWVVPVAVPHRVRGAWLLALLLGFFALIVVSREFPLLVHGEIVDIPSPIAVERSDPSDGSWLLDKIAQTWGPSFRELLLTTVQRIEPVLFVAGIAAALVALRRRDPFGVLAAGVAVLVPASLLAISPIFPVGPRYFFPSFYGWALLAALWAVEIDRRLAAGAGRLVGPSALVALLVAVGFNSYLYVWDGSGQRERWREAFAYVERQGAPGDAIYRKGPGQFQAQYYLGRSLPPISQAGDPEALAPGTWVIERSRGRSAPLAAGGLEPLARYEISSKPWSWVLYVLRVPAAGSPARHSR